MRLVRHGLVGVACLALAAAAYAQSTAVAVPENTPVEVAPLDDKPATWGDAKAGQTKAGTCAACHGLDGNPADPLYPRLAGMPERYIAQQLAQFKNGERTSGMAALMVPFASMLSAQDMRDVGAWYATQAAGAGVADDTVIASGPNQGMKFYQVGERLFRGGDAARGLSVGERPAFRLRGAPAGGIPHRHHRRQGRCFLQPDGKRVQIADRRRNPVAWQLRTGPARTSRRNFQARVRSLTCGACFIGH